jgi:uncharacterized protein YjbJ (UPF0337 family)
MPTDKTRDKIEGQLDKAKGRIKQAAGKATGDPRKEERGAGDRVKGTLKNKKGHLKDLT